MTSLRTLAGAIALVLAGLSPALANTDAPDPTTTLLATLFGAERAGLAALTPDETARLAAAPARTRAEKREEEAEAQLYTLSWLAAQPTPSGDEEWECLTQALYFEARGETVKGQFAVAEVILNRADSPAFPATVCGVVNQGTGQRFACQFTFTCDGRPEEVRNEAAWNQVGKVARAMLDGAPRPLTFGATYYHTNAVAPRWARIFYLTAQVGDHLFYKVGG